MLRWEDISNERHRRWLEYHRELLAIRRSEIVPRLTGMTGGHARWTLCAERALRVDWTPGDTSRLALLANLDSAPLDLAPEVEGHLLYATPRGAAKSRRSLAAWSSAWYLLDGAKP